MRAVATYRRLLREASVAWDKVERARVKLAKNCPHPPEFVIAYEWEHDNGYGRQTHHHGKRCLVCKGLDAWNEGTFEAPR